MSRRVPTWTVDRQAPADKMKCAQCGATAPPNGFTTKNVIHQGRDAYGVRGVQTSIFTVCEGTPCGGHLQMAHEG